MSAALVLELLFKSGVIAGAGLILATALRRRPAAERVDILRVTVCLLIALPLFMAIGPGLAVPLWPQSEATSGLSVVPVAWSGAVEPVKGVAVSGSILWPSAADLVRWIWAAGCLVVLGRFTLGIWTLRRWTRQGRAVTSPPWTASLDRLTPASRPRLIVSSAVSAPLSWGMPPGVVLIGEAQLARPETARAVLAHELAHLRRGDWIFLVLSRVALGLFWFNPLVWMVHASLSARSEEAADATALDEVDRGAYARVLVDLASDYTPPAALGMAGPAETLTRRIACIMKTSVPLQRRPLVMAMAIGALIGVATPIAALEPTPRASAGSVAIAHAAVPALVDAGDSIDAAAPAAAAPAGAGAGAGPGAGAVAVVAPVAFEGDWSAGQEAYAPPPPPPPPPAPPAALAAPPAPPVPPAPPAPPARAPHAIGWISNSRPLTEQERQAVAEARQAAVEARIQAQQARREAVEARARAPASVAAAPEARAQARAAMVEAAQARARAGVAREHAAREVANARVHMARGADEMGAGAERMREESARLRDPAYRATQIERARVRGETVTDAELEALSPRLAIQADRLERRAVELRERAARQTS